MNPLKIWKLFVACMIGAGLAMSAHAATYTPQEEANVKLVADFYAALDNADAHSGKKFGPGREGFIRFLESMPAPPAGMVLPPAQVLSLIANGDIVIRVSSRMMPTAPGAPANPSYIFNMFRIQNGKLAEHWDASSGAAMGPGPAPATPEH